MKEKTLKRILKTVCYIGILFWAVFRFALTVAKNKDKTIRKYKDYYRLMVDWLSVMEEGRNISDYLKEKGYYKVAIYGAQDTGWHLAKQLQKTEIELKYIIDRSVFSGRLNAFPIYRPDDQLPEVDAIIVTPVWDYQNIKEKLLKKVSCQIISLQEIIEEMKDV